MDVDDLKKKIIPIYRIIVLGAKQVGKTSLINQFVNNSFDPFYEMTENDIRRYIKVHDLNKGEGEPSYIMFEIEDIFPLNHDDLRNNSDFVKSQILYGFVENKPIKLQNKSLNIMQLDKQLYGYMFVFDASDLKKESFKEACTSIRYISDYCEKKSQKSGGLITQKILVANKTDLIDKEKQQKLDEDARKILDHYPMPFVKASSQSGYNVTLAFEELGKAIKKDIKLEMKGNEWLKEIGNEIQNIEDLLLQESKNKNNNMGSVQQNNGFLGCGGRDKQEKQDSDEEQDEYDQEDDEFSTLPLWTQSMDENSDGCSIY